MVTLPVFSFWEFLEASRAGIPFTLYLSVLLGLSYTARKKIRIIPSIVTIFLLAVGCTVLSVWATAQIPPHPYITGKPVSLARDGLIMTADDGQKSALLTAESPLPLAAALKLDETPQASDSAKPLSFRADRILFVQDVASDFLRLAENLDQLQETGFVNIAAYTAGLVVLLVSMRFIMDLSAWALANLFFGFAAFGGILIFELFINSSRTQRILLSLVGGKISAPLISPLVFCTMGLFVIGATGVVYLVKKGKKRSVYEEKTV
jgi:hypothetical protein